MNSEQAAKIWQADLFRLAWLRSGIWLSMCYFLAWGITSLIIRGVVEPYSPWLWWGAAGLLCVWIAAGVLARRQVPSLQTTLALLDRENQLGGLLMAESASGREAWTGRLEKVRPPHVRWRGKSASSAMGLSVVFVLAALLVPMPDPTKSDAKLDVSRPIAMLQQQLDVLEEEKILDSPDANQVRQALDRIKQEARGDDPRKTWEALDHLASEIDQASQEASDLARQRIDEAAGAEALTKALQQQGAQSLDGARLSQAMAALEELSAAAAGEPTLDGEQLPPDLAQALSKSVKDGEPLSPEMLEQLAEAMAARQADLQEMLQALEDAGLAQAGEGEGEAVEQIDPTELLELLSGEGDVEGQDLLALLRPGRGGITRGPGHADMIWQDPSSEEGVEFAPELLPPSRLRELADAKKLGTSQGSPQVIEGATGSSGGALSQTQSGGGSADDAVVLPRHRGAVQRYFNRDQAEE